MLKAVVLLWFSVVWFWCPSFGDVSPYTCSYHYSSVYVAEWPPFGKELLTRLTICSLCILTVILVISRFSFEGGIWVLIAPVSGHCLLVTCRIHQDNMPVCFNPLRARFHEQCFFAKFGFIEQICRCELKHVTMSH